MRNNQNTHRASSHDETNKRFRLDCLTLAATNSKNLAESFFLADYIESWCRKDTDKMAELQNISNKAAEEMNKKAEGMRKEVETKVDETKTEGAEVVS